MNYGNNKGVLDFYMNSNLLPVTQVKTSSEILSKKDLFSIFWKEVFLDADKLQCSDIHVEPYNDVLQVRARVNGELKLISKSEEKDFLDQFIVRLKEIARLDISVRDEVQDGDFELKQTKSRYRTVLSPTRFGESFVFRVIKDEKIPKLSDLNLEPRALKDLKYALSHKQGFVCITGPTGSGKSSTLQACLMELDRKKQKIITLEDPIERFIPDICQQQITYKVTWAKGIKTAMRQDPDVILIGEIRDPESAKLALQAAQTGHLVLATLHTNDVAGTVDRLIGLGIDRHIIADNLLYVSAQRLIPSLCQKCKTESKAGFVKGEGCDYCHSTGVSGRIPVIEYSLKPSADSILSFNKYKFKKEELSASLCLEIGRLVQSGVVDERNLAIY